jgi:hypothetical protein
MLLIGNKKIEKLYIGGNPVKSLYKGLTPIYRDSIKLEIQGPNDVKDYIEEIGDYTIKWDNIFKITINGKDLDTSRDNFSIIKWDLKGKAVNDNYIKLHTQIGNTIEIKVLNTPNDSDKSINATLTCTIAVNSKVYIIDKLIYVLPKWVALTEYTNPELESMLSSIGYYPVEDTPHNNIHIITLNSIENEEFKSMLNYINPINFINFRELIFFKSVTEIPENSFKDCVNLEFIELPFWIRRIKRCAFENCQKLINIEFPEDIYTEEAAFRNCKNLKYVLITGDNPSIHITSFEGCNQIKTINSASLSILINNDLNIPIYLGNNNNNYPSILLDNSYDIQLEEGKGYILTNEGDDKFNASEFNKIGVFTTSELLFNLVNNHPTIKIQHINGELYSSQEWKTLGYHNDNANGIAVISNRCSFVVPKTDLSDQSFKFGGFNINVDNYVNYYPEYNSYNPPSLNPFLDFNGTGNTNGLLQSGIDFPVIKNVNTMYLPNGDKLYLPSVGELRLIALYSHLINAYLVDIGGTPLKSGLYWSSTTKSKETQWCINFSTRILSSRSKDPTIDIYARGIGKLKI